MLVTGIGGTGVVTIGALLGMAAHLEGKGCSVLDMTGLAQKNGAVVSHVRIADTPEQLHATRIAAGEAKLVLACDILTGVGHEAIAKMQKGVTKAVVNTALVMPAQFTREPDLAFPTRLDGAGDQGRRRARRRRVLRRDPKLATGLMGDSIATNLFMVGYAYQRGLLPVGEAAILRAIELNGAGVESNRQSFYWGRLAAVEPAKRGRGRRSAGRQARVAAAVADRSTKSSSGGVRSSPTTRTPPTRSATPTSSPGCARSRARSSRAPTELTEAVARYYFKLLAIKDEYEVARLYAETDFVAAGRPQFEGDYKLTLPPRAAGAQQAGGENRRGDASRSTARG